MSGPSEMSDSGSGEDPSPPPSPPATPGDGGALETLALDAPSADKARIAALEKENADLKEQLRLANQKIEALQTRLNKGKKPAGPAKSSGKPRNKALPGRKKKMEVKSRLFEDNRAAKIKAKKEALEKAEMAECTFGKKKGATKKASSATFNRLYGNAAEKDKRSKAKRLAAEKAELESTRSPIPKARVLFAAHGYCPVPSATRGLIARRAARLATRQLSPLAHCITCARVLSGYATRVV